MSIVVRPHVPTPTEVMQEVFKEMGADDDCYWVLMSHGTFYTFPRRDWQNKFDGDEIVGRVLQMCKDAVLSNHDDGDCVTVMEYRDLWTHPTFIVLSCLRQKLGWVVVAESSKWPETEQQSSAVGYLARTHYEMDCHEASIVATNFTWSAR